MFHGGFVIWLLLLSCVTRDGLAGMKEFSVAPAGGCNDTATPVCGCNPSKVP